MPHCRRDRTHSTVATPGHTEDESSMKRLGLAMLLVGLPVVPTIDAALSALPVLQWRLSAAHAQDAREAFEQLAATEPFYRYPEMLAAFKEQQHIGD